MRERAAYALALLPVLTDWIDTGHWPQHVRELSTEAVIGLLILLGVHRLHSRADRFRELAETDALTGLGSRARFRLDLDAAIARARVPGESLALAFLDVDRLKQVNDERGHEAGDELLREVGRALTRPLPPGARGYRLGGDEFAVLLPNATSCEGLDAIRRAFESAAPTRPLLSCSVGVVELAAASDAAELMRGADELMYAAKRGRLPGADDRDVFAKVAGPTPPAEPVPSAPIPVDGALR